MSLSAPTFKFYQPKTGEGSALGISLTKKGFEFAIEPAKNDAIVYVDIPYATVKLENAATDRIVAQVEKCPSGALSYRKA